MFVRKTLAGAVTVAVTGSVLALSAGAASAAVDPDDTTFTPVAADVIGVGSDTSQNALFRLAGSYNSTVTGGGARLASFAATGGGQITLPSGAVNRPNGSGAGKSTLYGAGNNADVDFARSSSSLSSTEVQAGLQQFPFALDTLGLVTSRTTTSNAPATITPQQMVAIYSGSIKNWSEIGGTAGVIEPKIPQAGSGTRSFFIAQLTAANNGVAVTLASTVAEVQENDPAPIATNPNAVAPFSTGRAALAGNALRVEQGFRADRALYNVVRNADLGKPEIQGLFGATGFVCSDDAIDEIEAAGFQQLDSVADGGACGSATQSATSNFQLNQPVVAVPTTTTVSGASTAPRALRLTARVAGSTTPTGTVTFVDDATDAVLGTANVIGGTATLNLTGRAPGAYTVTASYEPTADSAYVASAGTGTVVVKAGSVITESFPASAARKAKSLRGVVTVAYTGLAAKPAGRVVVKEGAKTVASGNLSAGKVTLTVAKSKVGAGKSTLTVVYAGDARGFGSQKTFTVTFKK